MEPNKTDGDQALFESTMKSLEAQVTNVGAHLSIDTKARLIYAQEIKRMSDTLRADVAARRITWAAAARQAQETRNLIMGIMRSRSTPVGRAFAEKLKLKGLSLNQLIALKTFELYGEKANFSRLSSVKQNAVYAGIVTSAGNSNAIVTRAMGRRHQIRWRRFRKSLPSMVQASLEGSLAALWLVWLAVLRPRFALQ